ncbi:hypothetical protein E2B64_07500, partial [Salmonella enterica]|nr:hypothetical protein [Salmonella enterica]
MLIYLTKIALPEIIFKYAAQFYIFFRNIYPTNNYYKFFRLFLLEEALKEASSNAFCINQNLKKTTICGESSTFCLNYRHH